MPDHKATQPYHQGQALSNAEALISPGGLGGWDTKQRPRGGVQGMGFTGETKQSFHQH